MVDCYIADIQNNPIRTIQKSRDIAPRGASYLLTNVFLLYFCNDGQRTGETTLTLYTVMAEEHPPSPEREDILLSLGRLRVKPAMTVLGEDGSSV